MSEEITPGSTDPQRVASEVVNKMKGHFTQPIIEVYDPQAKTDEAISRIDSAIINLKDQQRLLNYGMVAVIVVVALGFITTVIAAFTIFIDHQNYMTERFDKYIDRLEIVENQIYSNSISPIELDK